MTSTGSSFIAILLVWITGLVVAFYLFLPDIKSNMNTLNAMSQSKDMQTIKDQAGLETEDLTDYSPLEILDILHLR